MMALLCGLPLLVNAPAAGSVFEHFITRRGDRLFDGESEWRAIGANMPGLVLPYDYTLDLPERMVLPTPWEQADGFRTLVQMGCGVARTWNLPIRSPNQPPDTWHHVQGPGRFNEAAFVALDHCLALANRFGVRLILPLSADYGDYLGGIATYAAHRGKSRADFWVDPQLKDDYRATVRHVVERINTVSGVPYREDKAILAWQFGNEFRRGVTPVWQAEMAAFLKGLDPHHLIIYGQDNQIPDPPDPNVDIVTRHYYGGDWLANLTADLDRARGKRPLLIGEYGLTTRPEQVAALLDAVIDRGCAGALLWSLYCHREAGGFWWHQIHTHPSLWAYHWPGFPSGEASRERDILRVVRERAFRMQGRAAPPLPVPEPPELLPIGEVPRLTWRGSTGARGYDIERAEAAGGPWTTIATDVSDADTAYRPLFADETARAGATYWYRVSAVNESGRSAPSQVVGPVTVSAACLADELADLIRLAARSGRLEPRNDHNAWYAEYPFRLAGEAEAWLEYRPAGEVGRVTIWFFSTGDAPDLRLSAAADEETWTELSPTREARRLPAVQGQPPRMLVTLTAPAPPGARWVRITWAGPAELDRVELEHTGPR